MASPVDAARTPTNITTASSPWSVGLPASSSGELLIVYLRSAATQTWNLPNGWTWLVQNNGDDASDDVTSIIYKIADGTEGTALSVTPGVSCKGSAIAWRITGHGSSVNPPVAQQAIGTGANPNSPSISPTGGSKDYLFLAIAGLDGETQTYTVPSGYSNLSSANSGTGGAAASNNVSAGASRQATTATEDPPAFTAGAPSNGWTAYTIAIYPAGPTPVSKAFSATFNVIAQITKAVSASYSVRAEVAKALSPSYKVAGLKLGTQSDNFNDGTIDSKWTLSTPAGTQITESSGSIRLQVNAGANAYCNFQSAKNWDARDTELIIHVDTWPLNVNGADFGFMITDGVNRYLFAFDDHAATGSYYMVAYRNSTILSCTTDVPAGVKWFRIRHSDPIVFFEYSSDGVSWTNYTSETAQFDISIMRSETYNGLYAGTQPADVWAIDSINLRPVSKALTANYTVKAAVTKALSPTYTVKVAIVKNLGGTGFGAGSYGSLDYGGTPGTRYFVNNLVQKSLTANYNIASGATSVQKDLAASYNVVQGISKSLAASYTVKASVSKTETANYNVRVVIAKALSGTYTLRQTISKALSATYDIIGQPNAVQKSLAASYNVRAFASKALTANYSLRVYLSKSLSPAYSIRVIVSKGTSASYTLRASVDKTLSPTYSVSGRVGKSLTANYDILGYGIQKQLTANYSVSGAIPKALTATFFIRTAVTDTLTVSYSVIGGVAKQLTATYVVTESYKMLSGSEPKWLIASTEKPPVLLGVGER